MHLIRIFWAIQCYKNSIYDDLLLKWWENYKIINRSTFNHLKKRYKKQFHQYLLNGLTNTNYALKILTFNQEIDETQLLLKKMLYVIDKKVIQKKLLVINENLKQNTGDILAFFISQSKTFKANSSIPILLNRLDDQKISNYDFLQIVKAILAYDNAIHKYLLVSVLKEHPRLIADPALQKTCHLLVDIS